MSNKKFWGLFVLIFCTYCSNPESYDSQSPVRLIMANTTLNQDGSLNISWKASENDALVYIYANKDKSVFRKSDLAIKTIDHTVKLDVNKVQGTSFLHLVLPKQDTLSLNVSRFFQ